MSSISKAPTLPEHYALIYYNGKFEACSTKAALETLIAECVLNKINFEVIHHG